MDRPIKGRGSRRRRIDFAVVIGFRQDSGETWFDVPAELLSARRRFAFEVVVAEFEQRDKRLRRSMDGRRKEEPVDKTSIRDHNGMKSNMD